MRATIVQPTGVERTFDDDEIIVSKTDTRGVLTYVNDVFVRVSGYSEEELIGRPHNVIRHPDMPRCIFKLFWDTISRGSEIFAYVVNLSADGSHYWVFAHVTPTFDHTGRLVGYHSNRRTPGHDAVARVEPPYRALLSEERRHSHPSTALTAGTELLQSTLAADGVTYDELVWSIAGEQVSA